MDHGDTLNVFLSAQQQRRRRRQLENNYAQVVAVVEGFAQDHTATPSLARCAASNDTTAHWYNNFGT